MKSKNNLPPVIMVIFGGSGDLTNRKLMPALFNLFIDGYLPSDFIVLGVGRTTYGSDEKYREHLFEGVTAFSRRKENIADQWSNFRENIFYLEMDETNEQAYQPLAQLIDKKTKTWKQKPVEIYYMAVAPQLAPEI